MADCFFHTRSLRTLEIPPKGGGGGGIWGCVKRESSNFSISREGDFVLFGNSRVGNSRDAMGFFSYKIIVLSPLWEKMQSAIIKYDTSLI